MGRAPMWPRHAVRNGPRSGRGSREIEVVWFAHVDLLATTRPPLEAASHPSKEATWARGIQGFGGRSADFCGRFAGAAEWEVRGRLVGGSRESGHASPEGWGRMVPAPSEHFVRRVGASQSKYNYWAAESARVGVSGDPGTLPQRRNNGPGRMSLCNLDEGPAPQGRISTTVTWGAQNRRHPIGRMAS